MNRIIIGLTLLVGVLLNMRTVNAFQAGIDDDPLWQAYYRALNEGQPKTALEKLKPIAQRAKQTGDVGEQVRELVTRINLQTATTESAAADTRLKLLREAIQSSEPAVQPVLEAVLASWFWEFFQQHRWQYAQRTTVANESRSPISLNDSSSDDLPLPGPEDDLLTWDLSRILRAIDVQFTRSLKQADHLKQVPADRYRKFLRMGSVPAQLRPTMYDILMHHALQFYSTDEQVGSRSAHAFVLSASSPALGSLDDFLAWAPESRDERAANLIALRLFQQLLRFHLDDADPSAKLDIDLARLAFAHEQSVGQEKKARYQAALERFQTASSDLPIWAQATFLLAELAHASGDPATAHKIAQQGLDRFPESLGGKNCYNLIQQILQRVCNVVTERVWNEPWPAIDVRYRNVTKVYFRMVEFDFVKFANAQHSWQPESLDEAQFQQVIRAKPVRAWSAKLPATSDFRQRVERLSTPQDLPRGAYLLLASHREDFAEQDNQISIAEVWVSNLALITRSQDGDGMVGGHLLDALTGQPVAAAKIQAWQWNRAGNRIQELTSVTTNSEGEFQFKADDRQRMIMLASTKQDRLSSASMIHVSRYAQQPARVDQTQFFTDRAIYRPGQVIRYKGICHTSLQQQDDYQTVANRKVIVGLFDVNHQEVERLEHRSNQYGSFSGSFTAPRGKLTGAMWVRVIEGPAGQATVRVEEYKRPKFQVQIDPPRQAAKLNEEVEVHGKATAYTGAVVDGANVQWRVVREVRYPPWWWWRMWWLPPTGSDRQEMARGVTTTGTDGAFSIRFQARPDEAVDEASEPNFHYTIYADVTDGTGETRSGDVSVQVGYTALSVSVTAEGWLTTEKPVELSVRSTTLDGQGQAAAGTLKIHALQQPETVARALLASPFPIYELGSQAEPAGKDLSNPNSWPLAEIVFETQIETDVTGHQKISAELPAGIYRVVIKSRDRYGKEVLAELPLKVFDLQAPQWAVKLPHHLLIEKSSVEPGQNLRALWSSGYQPARAFVEIEHRGKMIQRFWTDVQKSQALIELPITEQMRGGVTLHVMFVQENRAYLETQRIDVPWSNKDLQIRWEHFTSKLGPAEQQSWTAVISGQDAQRAAAEMVATLYDASLDVFTEHHWLSRFGVFRQDYSRLNRQFNNLPKPFQFLRHNWSIDQREIAWVYPTLDLPENMFYADRSLSLRRGGIAARNMLGDAMMKAAPSAAPMMADGVASAEGYAAGGLGGTGMPANESQAESENDSGGPGAASQPKINLDGIPVRTNLNETAFFFPHIVSGDDGVVRMQFTMPEALTRWRFLGFAHDRQLRGGLLSDSVTTSKDLMIQPNAPRFLREGDQIEFTVKITNLSPTRQTGSAGLEFLDPISQQSVDAQLANSAGQQSFDVPAGASQSLAWRIVIPDGLTTLTYRAKASTGRMADGEEGYLPVLSRRILVSESLPLPIRGQQTKQFTMERLLQSTQSSSIKHQSLTVQMASNPAWYAVMALPYLMEYPHQCSEQIFSRLYANALARHIAQSDPKIGRVFEQWRGTETLDSPLSKNQDLKAVLLEETPWFQQADTESQSRRNVGLLFDNNRLNDELARAMDELSQRQLADGRWSWFPGGPGSDYITLYITTGFGRLQHLGVKIDPAMAIRSLQALDEWMAEQHRLALAAISRLKDQPADNPPNFLSPTIAFYLYGRSFFATEHPIGLQHQESLKFWMQQAKLYWLQVGSLQSQAHLALALHRLGDQATARQIMASLKERSLSNDELGTYWRTANDYYWWYHAPIESQAALIEAFDEVVRDAPMVEDCKVWLLKQKQTQAWKSTKATADAVYALMLRGTDLLASDKIVQVSLADQTIRPDKVEAGTGFYQQRFVGDQIQAQQAKITVTKQDAGVAWGSIHWQYFEDIDRITANPDNPLTVSKELYVKRLSDTGPQLERLGQDDNSAQAKVGDELVVRIVLKVDRDMEFVHLKDHRGSGTEPTNVLSGYRYQGGLGYYEATRDAASHFFIDYLRKGTYVFEYSTRVQLRGDYQTGMAQIQCMYAPEFNSHSQTIRLQVK